MSKYLILLGEGKNKYWGKFQCICGKKFDKRYKVIKDNSSCGCKNGYNFIQDDNYKFKIVLSKLKKNAKHDVILTELDLKEIWKKQDGKCIYTNIPLYLPNKHLDKKLYSIDRIDSSKPYHKENIQFTLKEINIMKQSMSHDEFIQICKLIAKNNPIQK